MRVMPRRCAMCCSRSCAFTSIRMHSMTAPIPSQRSWAQNDWLRCRAPPSITASCGRRRCAAWFVSRRRPYSRTSRCCWSVKQAREKRRYATLWPRPSVGPCTRSTVTKTQTAPIYSVDSAPSGIARHSLPKLASQPPHCLAHRRTTCRSSKWPLSCARSSRPRPAITLLLSRSRRSLCLRGAMAPSLRPCAKETCCCSMKFPSLMTVCSNASTPCSSVSERSSWPKRPARTL